MHSDPETAPGALAQRPTSQSLAESGALSGGAGLFDHSARDALSPSAGVTAGILAVVATVGLAIALVTLNPSLASGKAGGTPNQLAALSAAAALVPGSPEADGAQIISSKACPGCHVIPGIPTANGQVGPNLGGVAGRTKIAGGAVPNSGPDDLKKWILNPPGLKPGTAMPNLGLTDDEATKIVAYLETLK